MLAVLAQLTYGTLDHWALGRTQCQKCQNATPPHLTTSGRMGSGHANYLKLLKNKREKTPLFRPYIELFRGKKTLYPRPDLAQI